MSERSAVSLRTLNRTLLERQHLLRRSTGTALDVVRHLGPVQGQEHNAPYIGLWTRIAGFRHDDLAALLHDRSVVRGTLIRMTQHLAAAEDYLRLRPLIQPALTRMAFQGTGAEVAGLGAAKIAEVAAELLGDRTMRRPELGRLLAERFPGYGTAALTRTAHCLVAQIHPPPSGLWGGWAGRGAVPCALAERWIGRPLEEPRPEAPEEMVLRYLAAFGPATVKDVQLWSGVTRLREVVERLRLGLRVLRGERGGELFDLPDAVLADPEVPAPPRFLPAYDNVLIGHADRTRIIADEHRPAVMAGRALVLPTFLLDGFVRGTWEVDGRSLRISPFAPLRDAEAAELLAEAERLLDFVAPAAERAAWTTALG
ncbi:hypothetical protein Skr01_20640 [Sphaerisporangium krabiense]|uniref:Winged helix DNA-binding domain-containing protein n=1 Tax=Sphaerisporangium krabiense TaxID=763782 RepID=A0A7W9DRY1_9ACTN|nr:winged helix DNA-binding domain-containing protein [Sphaerisporangium krabiense]MBB5627820.1 hypothetical protein [Sphaerisporangium krabiense]GII61979.1 hypothetical protein Skr01_20640 [Sphaerisporangium krabiense]